MVDPWPSKQQMVLICESICGTCHPLGSTLWLVEVDELNGESLWPLKWDTSMGCLMILSLGMPTASYTAKEMMLIEARESSIALLSSTSFTLAVI